MRSCNPSLGTKFRNRVVASLLFRTHCFGECMLGQFGFFVECTLDVKQGR